MQRRASATGVVMVCGLKVALGQAHRYETVTIHVAETAPTIEVGGRDGSKPAVAGARVSDWRNHSASRVEGPLRL